MDAQDDMDMVKKQRLTAGPQSEAEADGAGTDPSD